MYIYQEETKENFNAKDKDQTELVHKPLRHLSESSDD
jgi:hypothetical protein